MPVNASSGGCGRGCRGRENSDVCSTVCTCEYKETVKMGAGLIDKLPSLTFEAQGCSSHPLICQLMYNILARVMYWKSSGASQVKQRCRTCLEY